MIDLDETAEVAISNFTGWTALIVAILAVAAFAIPAVLA